MIRLHRLLMFSLLLAPISTGCYAGYFQCADGVFTDNPAGHKGCKNIATGVLSEDTIQDEEGASVPPTQNCDSGQQFLKLKLAELDSFKSNPIFHQLGFGVGGQFNAWFNSVESKRNAQDFNVWERGAVGHIQMLGLEYMKTKGIDNNYTLYARSQINDVIRKANCGQ